jgi:hypothetical protein
MARQLHVGQAIESSYQEIEAQNATTLRFGLIDHPLRDLWAEVCKE